MGEASDLPGSLGLPGSLAGLRVVEVGDESIEYAGLMLMGLGAEVVKVEPPGGAPSRRLGPFYQDKPDPERSLHFWAYNRGKLSVVFDLECGDDRAALQAVIRSADVVLDSTPRGYLKAREIILSDDRQLIHARLTPFGDDGPWAHFESSDLVSLALGGVAMCCGYDAEPSGWYDLPPIVPQAWHSFHIAGEQLVIGVVAALVYRGKTGRGQQVSVAIHEAVSKNTELDVPNWVMLRQDVKRQTCRHAHPARTDPSMTYTKDGRWMLSLTLSSKRDVWRLKPFMDRFGLGTGVPVADEASAGPELVRAIGGSGPEATSNTEIVQRLSRRFTYDRLPWRQAQEEGLLWTPIRRPHENFFDTHWETRDTFADIEHPEMGRSFRYPVSRWLATAGSWRAGRRAPRLGEDTATVPKSWATTARASVSAELSSVGGSANGVSEWLSARGKPFALQGVRVLDFTWFLASAGATRFLASLGAEVLKVEWKAIPDSGRGAMVPQGGRAARDAATAPLSSLRDPSIGGQFNNKNPGKRGLSLNMGDARGREIARALIAKSDIVAEGFSPGVLERWGLGYEQQCAIKPDIIYVKQSGMGAIGEYGRFRALGPIAAALSGLTEMSGLPEPAPPAGWGYSYLDWFAAYSMALAMISALYHRDRTGEGQWIDASQTEVGIALAAVPLLDYSANGREWRRVGNRSPYQPTAPEGIYRCAGDDRWIAITTRSEQEWAGVATVAGHPEWLTDPALQTVSDRLTNRANLDAQISVWTSTQDAYTLMYALQHVGVPAGVCQNAEDKCDRDPQLRHLQWLTELKGTRIGTWPLAETSFKMSETPPYIGGLPNRAAPLYGEDNHTILTDILGLTKEEIVTLEQEGVL
jgi:crotonobetainyl-CoA:carnitine CoA-transferase CaiB-like acyl-CoA transferase